MRQYETFELKFTGSAPVGSEAVVDLTATFSIDEESVCVKGFYAGEDTYVVRFYPTKAGHYTWQVAGVVEATGEATCEPAQYPGMVKAEGCHFVYENGDPYYPVGTTIYALAHQDKALREQTMETLQTAPFNKVRHCLFPKHYDYNHNEPEFYPFEKKEDGSWDVHRPCYDYWKNMEDIIFRLGAMGIETDLILFHAYDRWGFCQMSMEENLVYLDYVLRRLAAVPFVWWSLANEYDIVFARTMEDWYTMEEFVVENDPYHHLISNHNCMKFYDYTRPNITHACIQTPAMCLTAKYLNEYKKPVVFDEIEYEGDIEHGWGNISGFELINRFWKCCTCGGYGTHGETFYSEDEILWWARGGVLMGESQKRLGYFKDFLYSMPGAFEPWDEPIFLDFPEPPVGGHGAFMALMNSLSVEEKTNLAWKDGFFRGHVGEDVYLQYYGEKCPSVSAIRLPQEESFKIEIIDVWEMTRETFAENVSGKVALKLPGKGGIAVVATRM